MKRLISMVLALVMLMSVTAWAEDVPQIKLPFSLEFDMPLAQAIIASKCQKRTVPVPNELYYRLARILGMGFDNEYFLENSVTVGGHKAEMYVYFQDGKLKQVEYHFKVEDTKAARTKSLNAVGTQLKSIYGDYYTTLNHPCSLNNSITYRWGQWEGTEKANSGGKSTYIVPYGDGCVAIENFISSISMLNTSIPKYIGTESHVLSYTYYDFMIEPASTTTHSTDFGF